MLTENDSVRLIFSLKIKSLRQEQGLLYQQLADRTGMSVSYIHDIEAGKKFPKADKILALSKVLGVDYDYLVSLRASKKLQPIIDLINSDFINAIPWEHFGLTPASLLDLFSNTPDKVTAFISTLLRISRSYQLSKESFYNAALRSYQDLHNNYFEEIETSVELFREQHHLKKKHPVDMSVFEKLLNKAGVVVDRTTMGNMGDLRSVRSFYSVTKQTLYINSGMSAAQEKFLIGREIAFQHLSIKERPFETIIQHSESFEKIFNNFKASYFAVAMLMPEKQFVEDVKRIVRKPEWNPKLWLDLVNNYDVTPEMMMQRLTNLLPTHFGIDHLFFLRMSGVPELNEFEMTKELQLSQLHNPYANALHEHYCRRWISINSIHHVAELKSRGEYQQPLVEAQISQYWLTDNRYFCISIAKPGPIGEGVSVTIGLLIDQKLVQTMPFVNDPAILVRTVHTTCERCGILDCKERAAAPVELDKVQQQEKVDKALQQLNEPGR